MADNINRTITFVFAHFLNEFLQYITPTPTPTPTPLHVAEKKLECKKTECFKT